MTLESIGNKKLRIRNEYVRDFLAEFLGTFILIIFGCGANAQVTLGRGTHGGFLSVNWGWGMGVALGVWVSGGVSGGHINPAVTLAMALLGKLKARKLPIYWLAQYLGAFAASACLYGIYRDAIQDFDGGIRSVTGKNATAGIWATYPKPFLTIQSGFADQVFGTMLLLLVVMAVTDARNMTPPKGMVPFGVGLAVFLIGMCFGLNCGFAINPARDLSPRLFTYVAGYGSSVFSEGHYWFWVPIVAPHVGAVCGVFIYELFVGFHFDHEESYDVDRKPVTLQEIRGVSNSGFQSTSELKSSDTVQF